ncbi:hypothetical protein E5Q_04363 [Mixia osmundae IAM 14324]|uniref:Prenylcysteine lyase domain-containing protein n=1 Tax=Mixia osmundae (strain CBS 9802 / IAM 14324 / JCM 22182 / KY 12970) TaxID=764103 RepID=G7E4C4_MIXOS|nr:hypothetical protein E5Q_04363 [Mixia osmundae IAM 14324]
MVIATASLHRSQVVLSRYASPSTFDAEAIIIASFNARNALIDLLNSMRAVLFFGSFGLVSATQTVFSAQSDPSLRVGIIGAGAGGSSAAFFLRELAKRDKDVDIDIHLYERSGYIGGRSTTVKLPSQFGSVSIELGASVFVDANRNLVKAASEFGLLLQDGHGSEADTGMAIWDGATFRYRQKQGSYGWLDNVKLVWQYGRSPFRAHSIIQRTIQRFLGLYQDHQPRRNVSDFVAALSDSVDLTKISSERFQLDNGVGQGFIDDLAGAASRVNYGQNPLEMHALGGMVSMAASGTHSVVGGNWQIFEGFVNRSGARVHLSTTVERLTRLDDGKWLLMASGDSGETSSSVFDVILLAAPAAQTTIEIVNSHAMSRIPQQDYVPLHVKLLVTNASTPLPSFFGLTDPQETPKTTLSTFAYANRDQVKRPKFSSLSYLRQLLDDQWVIKIFSEAPFALDEAFAARDVLWSYDKRWLAYPYLRPNPDLAPIELDRGLYYLNAFEPLISTMETATVASWNAVALVAQDFLDLCPRCTWAESPC